MRVDSEEEGEGGEKLEWRRFEVELEEVEKHAGDEGPEEKPSAALR